MSLYYLILIKVHNKYKSYNKYHSSYHILFLLEIEKKNYRFSKTQILTSSTFATSGGIVVVDFTNPGSAILADLEMEDAAKLSVTTRIVSLLRSTSPLWRQWDISSLGLFSPSTSSSCAAMPSKTRTLPRSELVVSPSSTRAFEVPHTTALRPRHGLSWVGFKIFTTQPNKKKKLWEPV